MGRMLFGSYAKGTSNDHSDLDFIVIKDTNLPKSKRGIELRRFFYGLTIPYSRYPRQPVPEDGAFQVRF